MNNIKETLISHCEYSMDWVHNLENLPEDKWREQIAKGKWTIAEIVGHLIPWDEYFMERISKIINEEDLPNYHIDEVNEKAAAYSRKSSKEDIIKEFIRGRKLLLNKIIMIDDEIWEKEFTTGQTTISLNTDLSRIIGHEEKHFEQINKLLN